MERVCSGHPSHGGMEYSAINDSEYEAFVNNSFRNGRTTHGAVDECESMCANGHHLEESVNTTRTIVGKGLTIV